MTPTTEGGRRETPLLHSVSATEQLVTQAGQMSASAGVSMTAGGAGKRSCGGATLPQRWQQHGTPSTEGMATQLPVIPALLLGLILKLFGPTCEPPYFLQVTPFLL